jgi:transcriptional regulator with XRE-family HTH domain
MPIPFQKVLDELFTPAEQADIRREGKKIVQRYLMLHELRKARKKTQVAMAKKLKINQVSVSRLENRADLLVSTLAKYVGAAGGKLHLVVQFPEQEPVFLKGFGELADQPKRAHRRKRSRPGVTKAAA